MAVGLVAASLCTIYVAWRMTQYRKSQKIHWIRLSLLKPKPSHEAPVCPTIQPHLQDLRSAGHES